MRGKVAPRARRVNPGARDATKPADAARWQLRDMSK
jgi:hypothetical protein